MNDKNLNYEPGEEKENEVFPLDIFPEDVFPEDVFPSDIFPRESDEV